MLIVGANIYYTILIKKTAKTRLIFEYYPIVVVKNGETSSKLTMYAVYNTPYSTKMQCYITIALLMFGGFMAEIRIIAKNDIDTHLVSERHKRKGGAVGE